MPLIKNRRQLAFGLETTPGTASSNMSSMFAFNPIIQPDIPMTERDATGTIGKLVSVPGARSGKLTFSVELAGGGSGPVAPPYVQIFTACGMQYNSTSHTLTPVSDPNAMKTFTVATYQSGTTNALEKALVGCMGTFTLEGDYGKPLMFKFTMSGVWVPPTDIAYPTNPAFPILPPRFASSGFSIGAYAPKISKFTFDMGNTVKVIEDVTTASAYAYAIVTERAPKGTIDPMATNVATWDPNGIMIAPTTGAMNLSVGSTTGNTCTLLAPALQIADTQEADRQNLTTNDIKFNFAPVTGDDEFSIQFT